MPISLTYISNEEMTKNKFLVTFRQKKENFSR